MSVDDRVFRNDLNIAGVFEQPGLEDWRQLAERALKGASLDGLSTLTHEGLTVKPLYTSEDIVSAPALEHAPIPRVGRAWEVCQQYRHPDPTVAAAQMAEDIARGVESVWVEVDGSIGRGPSVDGGYASDWNRGGVIIANASDARDLFADVDLATTGVHLGGVGQNLALAAAFLTTTRDSGADRLTMWGDLGFDPFGALVSDGTLTVGLDRSLALLPDVVAWTEANAPRMRALAVSTVPYTLAGATAVHELALGLATAVQYLRCLVDADIDPSVAARHQLFRIAIGRDTFVGIAKLRALRRMWARVIAASGGGKDDQTTFVHAITSPRSMTIRDPWVNMLRATVESFAAAAGCADAITVLPFDLAVGPSNELARRVASNTHAILRDESHLWRVTDPVAGSWYVERLTDELSLAAWSLFQQIEAQGGIGEALTGGLVQRLLGDALDRRRGAIAAGDDPITGVTSYPNPAEEPLQREPVDTAAIRDRLPRSPADRSRPTSVLGRLSATIEEPKYDGSITAAAIAAMEAGATVEEVAAALKGQKEETRITPLPVEREEDAVGEVSR